MVTVETSRSEEAVDITEAVADEVCVTNGVAHIFINHTTCAVGINEHSNGSVAADIQDKLGDIIPWNDTYSHDRIDDNAAAHIKAAVIGADVSIPVRDGDLSLGTWQRLLLYEFDGPRSRSVTVTCTSTEA